MTATVILSGSAALLSVLALILGTYLIRLRKENKNKRMMSLGGVFLALSFLPMALVMFAEFKRGSIPVFNYLAYFRSPFFMADFTFDVFAQFGQFSFLIDFFSTVTFTTIVVVSVSECVHLFGQKVYSQASDEHKQVASEASDPVANRVAAVPYIDFCRLLS